MAKDDLFVITYKILKYLYDCLKRGEKPETFFLTASAYSIPENYMGYILVNLIDEGYIGGITINKTKDGIYFGDLQDTMITWKGVEYLFENSLFEKVKKTLKDVADIAF